MTARPIVACTVASVREVTPRTRRLVLAGPEIDRLRAPAGALGPYLKLHLEEPGRRALVRTYSVRRHGVGGELEVDVVLHESGLGSDLVRRTRTGDVLRFGGPGWIPAEPCATYLLAGDHTALPAIAHILENLPAGAAARAVIEVPDRAEEQPLAGAAASDVVWLHRSPGTPSRLATVLRSCWPDPAADLMVWAGAECAIARAIRQEARRTRALPPARCQILNYWKAGQPEGGFSYVD